MKKIKAARGYFVAAAIICLGLWFLNRDRDVADKNLASLHTNRVAQAQPVDEFIRRAVARPDMANIQALAGILGASPDDASATIRRFLDSKADARTGLGFKVQSGGRLSEAPSVRVLLLDQWGQIDPRSAAAYAQRVLASKESPDEWAIALRNYAKMNADQAGRTFLEQKLREMLVHEPWAKNPSDGFLQAFDVAVYIRATNLIPKLTEFVRDKDNTALARAAYLTLDRMVISDAAAVLSILQRDPGLMQGRQETRANYFARADIREPAQREVIERYLLDPSLHPVELAKFAALYPNANYMVSQNLLTETVTPSGDWLLARDLEAVRVTREWLADERFARLKPQLETVRKRLEMFAQQAGQSAAAR